MMHHNHGPQEVQEAKEAPEVGDPWATGGRGHLADEEVSSWAEDWANSSAGSGHNTSSLGSLPSGPLHQTIIQGVLVCLFTTVGGVMLLVFCLIIVQECKVTLSTVQCTALYCTVLYCDQMMYVWAARRRHEEVSPPTYLEVVKPPSYSACRAHTHQGQG